MKGYLLRLRRLEAHIAHQARPGVPSWRELLRLADSAMTVQRQSGALALTTWLQREARALPHVLTPDRAALLVRLAGHVAQESPAASQEADTERLIVLLHEAEIPV